MSQGGDTLSRDEGSTKELDEIDLSKVHIEKVINESSMSKMITLLGTYQDKPIVIRLDKTKFELEATKQALGDSETQASRSFVNDIYSSYIMTPSVGALNQVQATIIWPANDKVLAKYTHDEKVFFSETQENFKNTVEPYIDNLLTSDKSYNNWVYNILEGRSEAERVIYNDSDPDSGFMLIPDLKWSGSMDDVNLLAICHRRDIRCLRDLNETHLPLLKNILDKGAEAIRNKFVNCRGQLRSYVHYHPSFYHFHVHFRMVDASSYESTDRDNLLSSIINNISLLGDYYAKSTLTYPLSRSHALHKALQGAGLLI